jgi:hypothetical protein
MLYFSVGYISVGLLLIVAFLFVIVVKLEDIREQLVMFGARATRNGEDETDVR